MDNKKLLLTMMNGALFSEEIINWYEPLTIEDRHTAAAALSEIAQDEEQAAECISWLSDTYRTYTDMPAWNDWVNESSVADKVVYAICQTILNYDIDEIPIGRGMIILVKDWAAKWLENNC